MTGKQRWWLSLSAALVGCSSEETPLPVEPRARGAGVEVAIPTGFGWEQLHPDELLLRDEQQRTIAIERAPRELANTCANVAQGGDPTISGFVQAPSRGVLCRWVAESAPGSKRRWANMTAVLADGSRRWIVSCGAGWQLKDLDATTRAACDQVLAGWRPIEGDSR